ncbi:adenine-specific methyltransferase EcoRI family protein [Mycobacterium sp.]|uniref:adenine-specific methyltransferase EcoRI family protein n=1 Tax=Mycobacterium sp. TaxID=1785 RepID=UPI003A85B9D9
MPRKNNVKTLNKAKANKNDEFYTTRKNAEDFLSYIKEDLNHKKVLLPCDTRDSEIYIVMKE